MHPIEKFHKMVLSGNVLGPGGSWISRNEALKKKKVRLKHIFAGEVEKDDRWISIKDLPSEKSTDASPSFTADDDVIHLNPAAVSENRPGFPIPTINANSAAAQEPPAFFRDSDELLPPQKKDLPQPPPQDTPTSESALSFADPVPMPLPKEENVEPLPPQPQVRPQPRASEPEPADTFQRETIAIRTIPLGKETSLTVSESRAGSALVAICSVQGFIDQSNADDFHGQLISMLDFGVRFFIIDFEHTTLVGSAGWGVLAVSARLIKASQGHLLICAMKDEIEESFLLLQFNEVIDSRKTITDCLDVIRSIIKRQKNTDADDDTASTGFSHYGEAYDELPLPEKIKTIIAQNGPLSLFQIAGHLKTERYGKVTINPVKLYILLKEMNLNTRVKRLRYYRSC